MSNLMNVELPLKGTPLTLESLESLTKKVTTPATSDQTQFQLWEFPENVLEELLTVIISAIIPRGKIIDLLELCRPGGGRLGKEEEINCSTLWDDENEGGWLYSTGIVPRELKISPKEYKEILVTLCFVCGYIPKFLEGYGGKDSEDWAVFERAVLDIKHRSEDELSAGYDIHELSSDFAEDRMYFMKWMTLAQSFTWAKFQNTIIASGILGLVNEYRSIEELTEDEDKEIKQFWGNLFATLPRIPYVLHCGASEAVEILNDAQKIKGQVIKLFGYKTIRTTLQNIDLNFVSNHADKMCIHLPVMDSSSEGYEVAQEIRDLQANLGDFLEVRRIEDDTSPISRFEMIEIADPREGMDITFDSNFYD